MLRVSLLVEPGVEPPASSARDRELLAQAAADGVGFLRVYTLVAETLVLGRYHRRPPPSAVPLARRLAGGRAAPGGPGFVGVSLVLPHRAALVANDPLALAPEQVMNRCVRGILAGLEAVGVPALYPGRETITAGGRLLGLLAFDVDAHGACLFEAVLALGSDLAALPPLLDRADPGGVVAAALVLPEQATSVARTHPGAGGGRGLARPRLRRALRRARHARAAALRARARRRLDRLAPAAAGSRPARPHAHHGGHPRGARGACARRAPRSGRAGRGSHRGLAGGGAARDGAGGGGRGGRRRAARRRGRV